MRALNIVGIGGGTGLPTLLRGLQQSAGVNSDGKAARLQVTAIVCVTDNGGSSGRLRRSFNIPAVGDLRNCLVALSKDHSVLAELFQHRFADGNGLAGHSLGNLIMTALCQQSGSLGRAAALANQVMPLKGKALPVTEAPVTLCARLRNGAIVRGESEITGACGRVDRLWLEPEGVSPSSGVLEAIETADCVVLGPGSLYTSLLPNLLVPGVAQAISHTRAIKVFVCNLLTERGETDGFSAADHLGTLQEYLGPRVVDFCIVNSGPISLERAQACNENEPVRCDLRRIELLNAAPIRADLASEQDGEIRHDPAILGRLIVSLAGRTASGLEIRMQPVAAS